MSDNKRVIGDNEFDPEVLENLRAAISEADGESELAALRTQLAACQRELEEARKVQLRHDRGESWFWQGDGWDFPESLNCPVIMQADKLRELLQRAESAEQQLAECQQERKEAREQQRRFKVANEKLLESWKSAEQHARSNSEREPKILY